MDALQPVRRVLEPEHKIHGRRNATRNSFPAEERYGFMAKKDLFRVVTRAADGSLKIRDFHSAELIFRTHSQVGVDDSSTDLDLRGMPIFRGLIGPMPEGKNIARYESPDVFESMTKEWATNKPRRRRRRSSTPNDEAVAVSPESLTAT
jgi:hypothetical protein